MVVMKFRRAFVHLSACVCARGHKMGNGDRQQHQTKWATCDFSLVFQRFFVVCSSSHTIEVFHPTRYGMDFLVVFIASC